MNLIFSGIGSNLKSSVINLYKNDYMVVFSRTKELINLSRKLSSTVDSRNILILKYLQMMDHKLYDRVIFDRALTDSIVMNKMNLLGYTDISQKHFDFSFQELIDEFSLLDIDENYGSKVLRFLFINNSVEIIESAMKSPDFKSSGRIDFYATVEGYFENQDRFKNLYLEMHPNSIIVETSDGLDIIDNLKYLKVQIDGKIGSNNPYIQSR